MTKAKTMMTKVLLGAMTLATVAATSAGASAATNPAMAVAAPKIERTTITLKPRPNTEVQVIKIRLKKPTTTKQLSKQVQTNVDASALNLDQKHTDSQLK